MGYVLYVSLMTYRRAAMKIHLYFKRLVFMKCFVKKEKEKKWVVTTIIVSHRSPQNLHDMIDPRVTHDMTLMT
jgi:hypothetical protein